MKFKTIGLFGHMRSQDIRETIAKVGQLLDELGCELILESSLAPYLNNAKWHYEETHDLASKIDLALVIGGDGALLSAARNLVENHVPLLGINRGSLGFLTDIKPHEVESNLKAILEGHYRCEKRFLLEALVDDKKNYGLNEIVLSAQGAHHLIQYEIDVDHHFLCHQRADGLIIATPTGSTAYALSGGGPIIHPDLNAITLVPMFPHTLSMRPIVINGDSEITLRIEKNINTQIQLGFDSQTFISVENQSEIKIKKKNEMLTLIHPLSYNYFKSLRSKLHWGSKLV